MSDSEKSLAVGWGMGASWGAFRCFSGYRTQLNKLLRSVVLTDTYNITALGAKWLPVYFQMQFKILGVTFKILHGLPKGWSSSRCFCPSNPVSGMWAGRDQEMSLLCHNHCPLEHSLSRGAVPNFSGLVTWRVCVGGQGLFWVVVR